MIGLPKSVTIKDVFLYNIIEYAKDFLIRNSNDTNANIEKVLESFRCLILGDISLNGTQENMLVIERFSQLLRRYSQKFQSLSSKEFQEEIQKLKPAEEEYVANHPLLKRYEYYFSNAKYEALLSDLEASEMVKAFRKSIKSQEHNRKVAEFYAPIKVMILNTIKNETQDHYNLDNLHKQLVQYLRTYKNQNKPAKDYFTDLLSKVPEAYNNEFYIRYININGIINQLVSDNDFRVTVKNYKQLKLDDKIFKDLLPKTVSQADIKAIQIARNISIMAFAVCGALYFGSRKPIDQWLSGFGSFVAACKDISKVTKFMTGFFAIGIIYSQIAIKAQHHKLDKQTNAQLMQLNQNLQELSC